MNDTVSITDKDGRVCVFQRELRPSQESRLLRLAGSMGVQPTEMRFWFTSAVVQAAFLLISIDSEVFPTAVNGDELEERMDLLGQNAISEWTKVSNATDNAAETDAVKN